MKYLLSVLALLLLSGLEAKSQIEDLDISMALLQNSPTDLLSIYKNHPEKRAEVEDAFLMSVDMTNYSYEYVLGLSRQVDPDTSLGRYFASLRQAHTQNIIDELAGCTLEQIEAYKKKYPERSEIADHLLMNTVGRNLANLSYTELSYVGSKSSNGEIKTLVEVEKNLGSRVAEVNSIMQGNVDDYCKKETELANSFLLDIEQTAWTFLFDRYSEVAKYYSRIGMVPDDYNQAAKQYRDLVQACISSKDLVGQLTPKIEKFCEQINLSRSDYATTAGKTQFPKLTLQTPRFDFSYNDYSYMLSDIAQARREFFDSKETNTALSDIASFFFGPLGGMIGKGILDMSSVETLADSEISCRRKYMDKILEELKARMENQTSAVTSRLKNELNTNQNEFINYIKK